MNDTSLRAITLNSEGLEAAIDVLSSAAASFSLTRREQSGYRALMVSVDLAIVSLALVVVFFLVLLGSDHSKPGDWVFVPILLFLLTFIGSSIAGIVALVLNIPLFWRILRERKRLNALGVKALSESLWKVSQRHRWLSRIRSVLIVTFGILLALSAAASSTAGTLQNVVIIAAFYAVAAATLFGARHLRNQREQMELAANADELKKALQILRRRAGMAGTISVPAELVEQVAKIESAHIARERKEAILDSPGSQSSGYGITFENKAAEQRATLDMADRLELEDLLAYMSTAGHPPESQSVSLRRGGAGLRGTTESKHVEVEYAIDHESRGIRITEVKRMAGEVGRAVAGASDA